MSLPQNPLRFLIPKLRNCLVFHEVKVFIVGYIWSDEGDIFSPWATELDVKIFIIFHHNRDSTLEDTVVILDEGTSKAKPKEAPMRWYFGTEILSYDRNRDDILRAEYWYWEIFIESSVEIFCIIYLRWRKYGRKWDARSHSFHNTSWTEYLFFSRGELCWGDEERNLSIFDTSISKYIFEKCCNFFSWNDSDFHI